VSVEIPAGFLANARNGAEWAEWLDRLPKLVDSLLAEWELRVDGTATHGVAGLVVPVLDAGGARAVLKVSWPHWEASYEHLALQLWHGDGAIRLLRADPHRYALLLERVSGRDLTTVPVLEACELVAGFYPRLHVPAGPQFRRLSEQTARWSTRLLELPTAAPVPRRYVEQAAALGRDFASDPATDGRLIHTDLHYFNVLAADREPWLVIDPKPLSGDPHYEVAPLLWNRWDEIVASGNVRQALRRRFHTVVDAAGLDEDRARDWVVFRELCNVLWSLEDFPDGGDEDVREWITIALTIAKAVQD
jgi:streptomycin 6-kinase